MQKQNKIRPKEILKEIEDLKAKKENLSKKINQYFLINNSLYMQIKEIENKTNQLINILIFEVV